MGHCQQVGHLTNVLLNLLEIHEIGSVDTSESKQQNYDQIWHMWAPYQKLLGCPTSVDCPTHLAWTVLGTLHQFCTVETLNFCF